MRKINTICLSKQTSYNIFTGLIITQFKTIKKHGLSLKKIIIIILDFPGGAVVKNPPANAGDTGSSSGPGRSHMLRSN